MSDQLRLALISTPRAGSTWLRNVLQRVYALQGHAVPAPGELAWEALAPRYMIAVHWHPTARFLEQLERHGFRVIVLVRHPLDVLISVLHFALYRSDRGATQEWLGGEGGNERPIFAAMPRSTPFLEYAVGPRATALLSVSHEWSRLPGVLRVRYEDLVEAPRETFGQLMAQIGAEPSRPLEDVLQETTVEKLRALTGDRAHFWQGMPGLWRRLLTASEAQPIAAEHSELFEALGYICDPDAQLTGREADANWVQLQSGELGDELRSAQARRSELARLRAAEATFAERERVVVELERARVALAADLAAAAEERSALQAELAREGQARAELQDRFDELLPEWNRTPPAAVKTAASTARHLTVHAFTVVDAHRIPHARVMARSLMANHPEARVSALVASGWPGHLDPAFEPFELLSADDVGLGTGASASAHDEPSAVRDVRPAVIRHLLREADVVLFLEPTIKVLESLQQLFDQAAARGVAALPAAPLGEGSGPVVAVARGPAGAAALARWSRLAEAEPPPGDGYLDVLRPARAQVRAGGEQIVVDGRPLRLVQFAGLDHEPHGAPFAQIVSDYRLDLVEAGLPPARPGGAHPVGRVTTPVAAGAAVGGTGTGEGPRSLWRRLGDLQRLIRGVRAEGADLNRTVREVLGAVGSGRRS